MTERLEVRRLNMCELLEIPPNHEFVGVLEVELKGTDLVFTIPKGETKEVALAPRTGYDEKEGLQE